MRLPTLGETFAGNYVIDDVLGVGGFGTVYRARRGNQPVALKVLKPLDGAYSFDLVARFNREARILSMLRDPRTVRLLGHGRSDDGLLYLAFELVEGEDLATKLDREGPQDEALTQHVLVEVLHSLAEAHGRALLHRDIKPENIRLTSAPNAQPFVTLLDFGIARDAALESQGRLTATGELIGTPRYMSPEQLASGVLSPTSDLFSLGMVAFEMLAGPQAMHGGTLRDQLDRVTGVTPMRVPPTRGPLGAVVQSLLATKPADRPQTAAQTLMMLTGVAPTLVGHENAQPTGETTAGVWTVPIVLTVCLLLAAIAGAVAWHNGADDDPAAITAERVNPLAASTTVTPDESIRRTDASSASIDSTDSAALDASDGASQPHRDCSGLPALSPGDHVRKRVDTVTVQGFAGRETRFYLPRGYRPDRRYPVVLLIHDGFTDGPLRILAASSFREIADKHGLVVIAPNDALIMKTAWTHKSFPLMDMAISAVAEEACIDQTAIFVVGSGFGGRPAQASPCYLPGVRAIATHGFRNSMTFEECDRKVPYLHTFGTRDPDMPPNGGTRCSDAATVQSFASVDYHDEVWRQRNGCQGKPRDPEELPNSGCMEWSCEIPYVSCHFDAGRTWHVIPHRCTRGGDPTPDLADKMWRFFERYR